MTPIIIPLKINKYNIKKIKFNIPPKNDTLLFLDGEGLNTGKKVPIEVPITESPQKMSDLGKILFVNVVIRTANKAWESKN